MNKHVVTHESNIVVITEKSCIFCVKFSSKHLFWSLQVINQILSANLLKLQMLGTILKSVALLTDTHFRNSLNVRVVLISSFISCHGDLVQRSKHYVDTIAFLIYCNHWLIHMCFITSTGLVFFYKWLIGFAVRRFDRTCRGRSQCPHLKENCSARLKELNSPVCTE